MSERLKPETIFFRSSKWPDGSPAIGEGVPEADRCKAGPGRSAGER